MAESEYTLHYWPLSGRGEYARLLFVEAGIPFNDHTNREEVTEIRANGLPGFPVKFPPILEKGSFHLSQTQVICKYLATEFGLLPEKEEDRWHAEQINTTIHDFIAEGRLAFHGKHWIGSYYDQVEETKPYIQWFSESRIQTWLKYFEAVLKYNNEGKGFLFGNKLTYVDLALLQALRACESSYPEPYKNADYIPLLKQFRARLEQRPTLAAYFKSDKCRPLEGNSMM